MRRTDFLVALVIGEMVALILLGISGTIEELQKVPFLWLVVFILPLLAILGIWLAKVLARRIPVIFQVAKFVLSGVSNVFIDLGILNLLMWIFGKSSGWYYPVFKTASFSVAVVNSYFLNRFWTFRKDKRDMAPGEFVKFYGLTAIGFLLNVGIASFIVNIIGPQWGISAKIWANVGAIVAVLLVCTWNFLGYKFIVFKK